jgi:hypothetical protein
VRSTAPAKSVTSERGAVALKVLLSRDCHGQRERLAELAHFDQRSAGIVSKIALGQRAKTGYLRVMGRQETEIRRYRPFRHQQVFPELALYVGFGRFSMEKRLRLEGETGNYRY